MCEGSANQWKFYYHDELIFTKAGHRWRADLSVDDDCPVLVLSNGAHQRLCSTRKTWNSPGWWMLIHSRWSQCWSSYSSNNCNVNPKKKKYVNARCVKNTRKNDGPEEATVVDDVGDNRSYSDWREGRAIWLIGRGTRDGREKSTWAFHIVRLADRNRNPSRAPTLSTHMDQ